METNLRRVNRKNKFIFASERILVDIAIAI